MPTEKTIVVQLSIICGLVVYLYPVNGTVNNSAGVLERQGLCFGIQQFRPPLLRENTSVVVDPLDFHYDSVIIEEPTGECSNCGHFLLRRRTKSYSSEQPSDVLLGNLSEIDYELDVVMVVPLKREEASMWAFLQPFTLGMWCTTAAIMIYTALVVYLLEQKINPLAYRESSIMEIFTHIWSAVSTMPSSQRLRIESSLAQIVIGIWLVVMFIIVSSYTSNLTSRLSAQQMKPTITSLKELLTSDVAVGYPKHAFTKNYLHKHFGIAKKRLKAYTTPKEYEKALSNGPNKGVAAILMNVLDARRFLYGRYNYTKIELLGSPPRVEMPDNIGVKNFLGLFIITGTMSTLALIIFFFNLLYNLGTDPNTAGQGTDTSPDDPSNEDEQSSIGGDDGQIMSTTNISDIEENTLIEASLVYIPHIIDETHFLQEHDV